MKLPQKFLLADPFPDIDNPDCLDFPASWIAGTKIKIILKKYRFTQREDWKCVFVLYVTKSAANPKVPIGGGGVLCGLSFQ